MAAPRFDAARLGDAALLTGASGGLGAALAAVLARPGVLLHLGGRDPARLAAVAQSCRARGASVREQTIDVRDAAAMAAWIAGTERLGLVIANAGISAGLGSGAAEQRRQVEEIFAVNLLGVLNTVLPAIERLAAAPAGADGVRGRIGAVASIAGFVALPGTPSYSASKAAVDTWMVASAPAAARRGVQLTSLCPGFIRTPMTAANPYRMPGLMAPESAAARMLAALAAGRRRAAFPWWLYAEARLVDLLPPALAARLLASAKPKPARTYETAAGG